MEQSEKFSKLKIQETPPVYIAHSTGATVQKRIGLSKWDLTLKTPMPGTTRTFYTFENKKAVRDFMIRKDLLGENEPLSKFNSSRMSEEENNE